MIFKIALNPDPLTTKVTPMNTVAPKTRVILPTVSGRVGNDYLTEVEVTTISLDHGEVVETSIVYAVGDQVECRLEDDPACGYIYPPDRRFASTKNRWFKGSISHIRRNTADAEADVLGVNEDYVIVVDLPGNRVEKILSKVCRRISKYSCLEAVVQCCFREVYTKAEHGDAEEEAAKKEQITKMKERIVHSMIPPAVDGGDRGGNSEHVTKLVQVFKNVAPVFNAVANATTTAQVQVRDRRDGGRGGVCLCVHREGGVYLYAHGGGRGMSIYVHREGGRTAQVCREGLYSKCITHTRQ